LIKTSQTYRQGKEQPITPNEGFGKNHLEKRGTVDNLRQHYALKKKQLVSLSKCRKGGKGVKKRNTPGEACSSPIIHYGEQVLVNRTRGRVKYEKERGEKKKEELKIWWGGGGVVGGGGRRRRRKGSGWKNQPKKGGEAEKIINRGERNTPYLSGESITETLGNAGRQETKENPD